MLASTSQEARLDAIDRCPVYLASLVMLISLPVPIKPAVVDRTDKLSAERLTVNAGVNKRASKPGFLADTHLPMERVGSDLELPANSVNNIIEDVWQRPGSMDQSLSRHLEAVSDGVIGALSPAGIFLTLPMVSTTGTVRVLGQ